jgi:cysteine-S-conjugate beta-lyase
MTLPNIMSLEASRAAYAEGAPWVDELLVYLDRQIEWFAGELATRFGGRRRIGLPPIEGTYLAWLDARSFLASVGARHEQMEHALLEDAALWLSEGRQFGTGGEGFFRVNLATPRRNVEEGLRRLERAMASLEERA